MRSLIRTRHLLLCSTLATLLSSSGDFGRPSLAQDTDKEAGVFNGQVILEGDIPKLDPAGPVDSRGAADPTPVTIKADVAKFKL